MLKEDIKECIAKVIEAAIRLTERSGAGPKKQLAQMLPGSRAPASCAAGSAYSPSAGNLQHTLASTAHFCVLGGYGCNAYKGAVKNSRNSGINLVTWSFGRFMNIAWRRIKEVSAIRPQFELREHFQISKVIWAVCTYS